MTYHKPVLLKEVVTELRPRSRGLYVDCTVGGGGHAREILRDSAPDGQLIGLDWDEEAIAASRERLSEFGARVQLVRANFVELNRVLMSLGVTTVDGILFDLGVSSRQFDEPSRGFSFVREGALDMRMSRHPEILGVKLGQAPGTSFAPPVWRNWRGSFTSTAKNDVAGQLPAGLLRNASIIRWRRPRNWRGWSSASSAQSAAQCILRRACFKRYGFT